MPRLTAYDLASGLEGHSHAGHEGPCHCMLDRVETILLELHENREILEERYCQLVNDLPGMGQEERRKQIVDVEAIQKALQVNKKELLFAVDLFQQEYQGHAAPSSAYSTAYKEALSADFSEYAPLMEELRTCLEADPQKPRSVKYLPYRQDGSLLLTLMDHFQHLPMLPGQRRVLDEFESCTLFVDFSDPPLLPVEMASPAEAGVVHRIGYAFALNKDPALSFEDYVERCGKGCSVAEAVRSTVDAIAAHSTREVFLLLLVHNMHLVDVVDPVKRHVNTDRTRRTSLLWALANALASVPHVYIAWDEYEDPK